MDSIIDWLNSDMFMPHGHCYLWIPSILWLHVLSDLVIGISYFSIPIALAIFVAKRKDLRFKGIFICFAAFILACGSTHFFGIYTTWNPQYAIEGLVKAFTALISFATALLVWPLLPKALALPSPGQLKQKNDELLRLTESQERIIEERIADSYRLAAIVDSSAEAILAKDINDNITDWNHAAEKLFGYSHEEVVGKSIAMLIPDEIIPEYNEVLTNVRDRLEPATFESFRVTKCGKKLEVSITVSPIKDKLGSLMGFSSIIRDITRQKEMIRSKESNEVLLRTIIRSVPAGLVLVDEEGSILLSNSAIENMLGCDQESLEKSKIEEFVPVGVRSKHQSLRHSFMINPKARQMGAGQSLGAVRKDGSEFPVEIGLAPIPERPLVLATIIDITERKNAENRIKNANEKLQKTNEELAQFVYAVSHDLKSPLVSIASFLDFLKEDIQSGNAESVDDSLMELERAQLRMKQLIDDLLEVSRIGRVSHKLELIDTRSEIVKVLEAQEEKLRAREYEVTVPDFIPSIVVSPLQFSRVIENLVVNAIKYASDGSRPKIEVLFQDLKDAVEICIKDNGPGIDSAYHEKIFQLFQRLDTTSEGSGLGLAIVDRIMRVLGGRVWLKSELGLGCEFWLSFPKMSPLKQANNESE